MSNDDSYRDIDRSEILITLYNMDQMHIKSLTINNITITPEEVNQYINSNNSSGKVYSVIRTLTDNSNEEKKYTYKSNNNNVTYEVRQR